jgi:hypothetical protein
MSDVTGSRKSKMAADIPEVIISRLIDTIGTKFQRLLYVFGLLELTGIIANTDWCNWKSEVAKMAIAKTEVLRYQLLYKIVTNSKGYPYVFGSGIWTEPSPIMPDVTGSRKSKMAADSLEAKM